MTARRLLISRRGIVTLVVAALLWAGTIALRLPFVALLPLCLLAGLVVALIWEAAANRRPGPPPAPFTRQRGTSGGRTMLRQDHNAHFVTDHRGFLFRRRIWFEATGCPPLWISSDRYRDLEQAQKHHPVEVAVAGDRHFWWWEEDTFYWENEGYSALDVQALVHRTQRQKERSLQHAHALLAGEKTRRRDPIPDDVRRFVWKRDGGRCQECGSHEQLQYDHIIPWSLGGADTAENLRLLCADCNRLKGDAI